MEFSEFSPLIVTSAPCDVFYVRKADKLKCHVNCTFDDMSRKESLKEAVVTYPGHSFAENNRECTVEMEIAKAFAACLLRGEVLPAIKQFSPQLIFSIRAVCNQKQGLIKTADGSPLADLAKTFADKKVTSLRALKVFLKANANLAKAKFCANYQDAAREAVWTCFVNGILET